MRKEIDPEGNAIILCVNHACGSNGGDNFSAVKSNQIDQVKLVGHDELAPKISLRDHFAGLAINAKIIGATSCGKWSVTAGNVGSFAEDSYMIADAMLAEREKGKV